MCVGDTLMVEVNSQKKYEVPEERCLHGNKLSGRVTWGKFAKEKQWWSKENSIDQGKEFGYNSQDTKAFLKVVFSRLIIQADFKLFFSRTACWPSRVEVGRQSRKLLQHSNWEMIMALNAELGGRLKNMNAFKIHFRVYAANLNDRVAKGVRKKVGSWKILFSSLNNWLHNGLYEWYGNRKRGT